MKQVELICVTADNNNKIYKMIQKTSSSWIAYWGRVGASLQEQEYDMDQWEKKYAEKLKKGYNDITSLRAEADTKSSTGNIVQVHPILQTLQRYAKQAVSNNYIISSESATLAQVAEAQKIIDDLASEFKKMKYYDINSKLKELYSVLPRKMKHTKDHFLESDDDKKVRQIIDDEQNLIDVMGQQIKLNPNTKIVSTTKSLEDELGIKISDCSKSDLDKIKDLLGANKSQLSNAWKVTNLKTEELFGNQLKESIKDWTKLLWHGSRNENWLNIVSTGLLIRPAGVVLTGAMFGNGIYFANKAQKSIGYTSLHGSYWASGNSKQAFLAIYEVNTGMEYRTQTHDYWMSSLTFKKLRDKGNYDSIYVKGGADLRNDEFIVYKPSQCTIRYLVEISKK